jgi:hypothetical protein
MAHLHLGLLAYWVVNTIRYRLKQTEKDDTKDPIHLQWKEIVRIMNTQKAVTTVAQNKSDEIIEIRRCSYPEEKARLIYDKLGYLYAPYKKKKSVVHKMVFEKNILLNTGILTLLEPQCGLIELCKLKSNILKMNDRGQAGR